MVELRSQTIASHLGAAVIGALLALLVAGLMTRNRAPALRDSIVATSPVLLVPEIEHGVGQPLSSGDPAAAADNFAMPSGTSATDLLIAFPTVTDLQAEYALKTLMRYSARDLERIENPARYAENLLRAALGETSDTPPLATGAIKFGTSVDGVSYGEAQRYFPSDAGAIYAEFSAHDYDSPHVIVRWLNTSSRQVVLFEKQLIVPLADSTYVWFRKPEWPEGAYQVDVYAENESLTPIATGDFQVYP